MFDPEPMAEGCVCDLGAGIRFNIRTTSLKFKFNTVKSNSKPTWWIFATLPWIWI